MHIRRRGRPRGLPLLLVLGVLASCSDKSLSLFFDIPPKTEKSEEQSAAQTVDELADPSEGGSPRSNRAATSATGFEQGPRPEIESAPDWKTAEEMLPKDVIGGADWAAALRDGVIDPRPRADQMVVSPDFNLDFFLNGPAPNFDAYFPHSAHSPIMDCQTCHSEIFRYKNNEITMADLYQGKYCGSCHGKVGFGLEACARCHKDM